MKQVIYAFLAGIPLLIASSCKKEALMKYKSADNIYFNYLVGVDPANNNLGYYIDSIDLTFSFSDASVQDSILNIPIGVTGVASDHDRSFNLTIDPSSTAKSGLNYELPESFLIRAGKIEDTIRIKVNRTPELKTSMLTLMLTLRENDQFKTQFKFRPRQGNSQTNIRDQDTIWTTTFKLRMADMLAAGPYWDTYYIWHFGTFSEKKVRLMNQVTGMPLSLWSKQAETPQERSEITYYAGFMARYLKDQAAAGNTILDEDGITPMKMADRYY
ncbi:DUF4843 domain-containing protein [Pseudobacter ginsenosidimutans]|jgi:hypothetical protein|uniref:Uncharacterized protein DUF4843 n=1 Tax=Pseudobacter ginsenosidimutans TaxID=661488 RepID=A0A4Q7MZ90_9BACT|nr:DUF4843 domain-containing protein [Pseudobacter ginsenosidimutans]QEC42852.1 DUF4843 domain-containing protein [Pseudobacter ginsenosidimutans]RZS74202.1 uncharacterized protein DUF4843 [Pseudobacter ginsenosidimutans]